MQCAVYWDNALARCKRRDWIRWRKDRIRGTGWGAPDADCSPLGAQNKNRPNTRTYCTARIARGVCKELVKRDGVMRKRHHRNLGKCVCVRAHLEAPAVFLDTYTCKVLNSPTTNSWQTDRGLPKRRRLDSGRASFRRTRSRGTCGGEMRAVDWDASARAAPDSVDVLERW